MSKSNSIHIRPKTASNYSNFKSAHQDYDEYSLTESEIKENNQQCQWTNKVCTQMNSQSRYQIDFRKKKKELEDLPKINMEIYNDQKFKNFLKNNFISMSQKDYQRPPPTQPLAAFKPLDHKENNYQQENKTTYQQTFRNYDLKNPDKFNKPLPNNIQLSQSKIHTLSNYQQNFHQKPFQNSQIQNQSQYKKTSPFPASLPLFQQTEHRTQFIQYQTSKIQSTVQIDNLIGSLSYKGQYVSENKKQYINKQKAFKRKYKLNNQNLQ